MLNIFAEKVIKLREINKMSQDDLANALNTTRQTVSRWEMGEAPPSYDILLALAELFHVEVDELIDPNIDMFSEEYIERRAKINQALDKMIQDENSKPEEDIDDVSEEIAVADSVEGEIYGEIVRMKKSRKNGKLILAIFTGISFLIAAVLMIWGCIENGLFATREYSIIKHNVSLYIYLELDTVLFALSAFFAIIGIALAITLLVTYIMDKKRAKCR